MQLSVQNSSNVYRPCSPSLINTDLLIHFVLTAQVFLPRETSFDSIVQNTSMYYSGHSLISAGVASWEKLHAPCMHHARTYCTGDTTFHGHISFTARPRSKLSKSPLSREGRSTCDKSRPQLKFPLPKWHVARCMNIKYRYYSMKKFPWLHGPDFCPFLIWPVTHV